MLVALHVGILGGVVYTWLDVALGRTIVIVGAMVMAISNSSRTAISRDENPHRQSSSFQLRQIASRIMNSFPINLLIVVAISFFGTYAFLRDGVSDRDLIKIIVYGLVVAAVGLGLAWLTGMSLHEVATLKKSSILTKFYLLGLGVSMAGSIGLAVNRSSK